MWRTKARVNDGLFSRRICTELVCRAFDHFDFVPLHLARFHYLIRSIEEIVHLVTQSLLFKLPCFFCTACQPTLPCSISISSTVLKKKQKNKPSLTLWGALRAKLGERFWVRCLVDWLFWSWKWKQILEFDNIYIFFFQAQYFKRWA